MKVTVTPSSETLKNEIHTKRPFFSQSTFYNRIRFLYKNKRLMYH